MDLSHRCALIWNLQALMKPWLNWGARPAGEEAAGGRGGPRFLSLCTVDIWGQMILCGGVWDMGRRGGCSGYSRLLISIPGLCPLDVHPSPVVTKMSPDVAKCPFGDSCP